MPLQAHIVEVGWLQAILLGILQGLTEFLPVSSTAHMEIAPQLMGQQDPGAAFSAIVQLGPIVAIIAYFRNDLIRYVQGVLRTKSPKNVAPDDLDARLGWYVIFASLPGLILGFVLHKQVETILRELHLVAIGLIVFAAILFVAEKIGKQNVPLDKMTLSQSQAVGWAQVLSLVPGVSRSGATITAGLFMGLDRASAARFSFLLGIPYITAAGIYQLYKTISAARHAANGIQELLAAIGPYLLAMVVAGFFAYVVIRWFLSYMKEHNTLGFVLYRIALGILLLVLLQMGKLHNIPKETEPIVEKTTSGVSLAP